MAGQLQIISGPDKGRTIPLSLEDALLLGRSRQTHSPLTDRKVSRVHCQIEADGDHMVLTDLESQAGTYINGKRITDHVLQPGDVIQIGETQICFLAQGGELADRSTLVTDKPMVIKPEKLPSDRLHELSGKVLSHYDLGTLLGKGASGILFRARDLKDDRVVALMVLFPEFADPQQQRRRFAQAMKEKSVGPRRVVLLNAGKTGPYYWLVTDYVEGKTQPARILADLDELIKSAPTGSAGEAQPEDKGRTDTVVEPPARTKPTDTVMEAPPKPVVRTETIIDENPKKPAVRTETIFEESPKKKVVVPTDTVVELHRPRVGARERGELNPKPPAAHAISWRIWLPAAIVSVVAAAFAVVWFVFRK